MSQWNFVSVGQKSNDARIASVLSDKSSSGSVQNSKTKRTEKSAHRWRRCPRRLARPLINRKCVLGRPAAGQPGRTGKAARRRRLTGRARRPPCYTWSLQSRARRNLNRVHIRSIRTGYLDFVLSHLSIYSLEVLPKCFYIFSFVTCNGEALCGNKSFTITQCTQSI